MDGGVSPTSIVGGMRSGTSLRNFSQAVVGANEPMPSVSKKLTIAPSPIASSVGRAPLATASRSGATRGTEEGQRQRNQQGNQHAAIPPPAFCRT